MTARMTKSEGIADCQHKVADLARIAVAEGERLQSIGCLDLKHSNIRRWIAPDHFAENCRLSLVVTCGRAGLTT